MLILLSFVLCLKADAHIILSEIMFNPAGNEKHNEYVELYNSSDTDSIDLLGWLLSDGTKYNTILPYGTTSVLKPGQYALVLVPNYFDESNVYEAEIPAQALIFTIDKSLFGAYGFNNTISECVSLLRPDTLVVASHCYTPDNADGFSEEKRKMNRDDSKENWGNSLKSGGTPGFINSVTPRPIDLRIASVTFSPLRPSIQDTLNLCTTLMNLGEQHIDSCIIIIQDSTNTLPYPTWKKAVGLNMLPGDSIIVRHTIGPLNMGRHTLLTTIDCTGDGNLLNNHFSFSLQVFHTYAHGTVVINEIMYNTDEKSEEWVEIYNRSFDQVDLQNWQIKDRRKVVILTQETCILEPGDYCLLTNNELHVPSACPQIVQSRLPELNNTGDDLTLTDAVGVLIDSVCYESSYGGGRFISLERIRIEDESTTATNWGSCQAENGCTPGQLNSISPREYDAGIEGAIRLEPAYPMHGDDVVVSFDIVNSGRSAVRDIRTHVRFHAIGENNLVDIGEKIVAHLLPRESALTTILWHAVPPGTFVLYVELSMPMDMNPANNRLTDSITVSFLPGSLVINEIMYSPVRDEAEWIELYNNSDSRIELLHWRIADSDTINPAALSATSTYVEPKDFIVLSQDSLGRAGEKMFLVCSQLPSLSNDYDDVFLYDGNCRIIDHVHYTSAWGGAHGRSLERINPNVDSNEASNWTTCIEPAGHTAGRENSVYIDTVPQHTSLSLAPDPFSPDGDGQNDHLAISYILPGTAAHVNVKIFDIKGRLVRFLLNNSPSGAKRTVYWDGHNDEGIKCRIGLYIVFFEAFNETETCIERAKKAVVLADCL